MLNQDLSVPFYLSVARHEVEVTSPSALLVLRPRITHIPRYVQQMQTESKKRKLRNRGPAHTETWVDKDLKQYLLINHISLYSELAL